MNFFSISSSYYKLDFRERHGHVLLGLEIMIVRSPRVLIFILLLGCVGYAIGGKTQTEDVASTESDALIGNVEAGEERYNKTCINCHGAGGKGVASFPKISGNEISFTTSRLETYREGTKIGPNSSLMIMMAKPLSDEEIANLAAYLEEERS